MQTKNLSIGYPKRLVASGINISLEAGKLSCLIGENGVGKSTLLRTLAGFQKPLAGELLVDGVLLQDIPKRDLAKKIAVVLTDKPDVQNTTVKELVSMGRMPYTGFFGRLSKEDEAIVEESLKITGVEPSRKVNSLSDGERQKVMIARALAQQTPYIFLDEPTAFLDYPSKVRTMEMLKQLARDYNKTILLSTHDLEIALAQADTIVMMEKKTPSDLPTGEGIVQVHIGTPKPRNNEKYLLLLLTLCSLSLSAANKYDNPDTLFVARDGSCEFRNVQDAIEVCRAYMTYHKVIFIKKGVYKEKVTVHHWLTNIELCGEDAEKTIITWDDHANVPIVGTQNPMGTFRTWTLKVEGNDITLKNLSIENNSVRKGQAVALHTTGDRIHVLGCRLLGHQDTLFTGVENTHLLFKDCYICGTTDFIFGPSTVWFEKCLIENKNDSYVTAASTPKDVEYGYVFNNCTLRAMSTDAPLVGDALDAPKPNAKKCYLGRPWRPYAYTLFMNCDLGEHILPEGWHNWGNKDNEQTARYLEYNNRGAGASNGNRVPWAKQLTKKDVKEITMKNVIGWEE